MCIITHRNASHAEQITPCEHFPKPTYNPFHFIKSHVNKSQLQTKKTHRVNEPSSKNRFKVYQVLTCFRYDIHLL